ncbi:MAG TPA: hypothetical protein VND93_03925 [Myxococcales bacterium]|jgi:hypothetical protein|nr:hypothetical protein [Myxococcales bacterium]
MRFPFPATAAALLLLLSCVKDISSEERLEREISTGPAGAPVSAADLGKISCADASEQLAKARAAERDETARLMAYMDLYSSIKKKVTTLEDAMSRDPDIRYQDGTKNVVDAHGLCVQQQADVRLELESVVRDLVQVPIVEEVKGGSTVPAARIDFNTLRLAIEALAPDDKDALLGRIASAEKKLESEPAAGQAGPKRRKGR